MHIIPQNVVDDIRGRETPTLVGVSGFGGSGKTTVSGALAAHLDAPVIGVDSFFKTNRQDSYSLWDVIDFERLKHEVIEPFLAGAPTISYGHFDWPHNTIGEQRTVRHNGVLIIEGVGLFRPGIRELFGYKIWIQCSPDQAIARGKKRDAALGSDHDEWWDGIWKRNDQEYYEACKPHEQADAIIDNSNSGA